MFPKQDWEEKGHVVEKMGHALPTTCVRCGFGLSDVLREVGDF